MPRMEEGIALRTTNVNDRIALRGVKLNSRVAGLCARTCVEQTFVNMEERVIEAIYTFPLPEGAAVCGFEIVFFDKVFTGVVEETDKANETYDDAMAAGDGAYLLEQHRPDVFTARVGNLKPRQAVTIRLTYVEDLQVVDRSLRLAFPTTIAPRYVTGTGTNPIDAAIDGDALNPPHVLAVPYGLCMEVVVDLGRGLKAIESPSHGIKIERAPSQEAHGAAWRVSFAGGIAEMDRDVVLSLQLASEQEPYALAAGGVSDEKFVAVSFLPEFDEREMAAVASETVFVIDCSGSMSGESIEQATAALECCLRAMSAGDTFNICRFGDTFQMLSAEPVKYSGRALEQALGFIGQGANLGGTELLPPLEAIFASKPVVGEVRNVVLLTDGQVSNEPAVIALAKRKRSRNRMFTFGIGSSCSHFLVRGLARVTGGAAEFIVPGERIEDKVLRTFGRIASPPVTDVEVEFEGGEVEAAPRNVGPIFDGDVVRVFGRAGARLPAAVTLRCVTPRGPRSWRVPVRMAADGHEVLPALWARAMIRWIEEETEAGTAATAMGSGADAGRLIELSKRYGVVCSRTSFVAVEHRSLEDRAQGKAEVRRVPLLLAAGWGEVDQAPMACYAAGAPPMAPCAMPAPMGMPPTSHATGAVGGGTVGKLLRAAAGAMFGGKSTKKSRRSPGRAAAPPPAMGEALMNLAMDGSGDGFESSQREASGDPLIELLAGQTVDGGFEANERVDQMLRDAGRDVEAIRKSAQMLLDQTTVAAAGREGIVDTLLALAALRLVFEDRRGTWKRAAQKAMAHVANVLQVHVDKVVEWIDGQATGGAMA